MQPKVVVFLSYEGAQVMDMAGPASVFAEANELASTQTYAIKVASPRGGPVLTRGGMGLMTAAALSLDPRRIDTLIVSGGIGEPLRRVLDDSDLAAWFKKAASHARRVGSTCTGAFVLAHWGLLDGRRATTHWQAAKTLTRSYPQVVVDESALFVEDGRIWTSAGVSTGIDMALAMVEQDLGRVLATSVAQRLVLQVRRPGHQSQFSSVLRAQAGAYSELIDWMRNNLRQNLSIGELARRAIQSERTFCRRFAQETGYTPAVFVERLRLDEARTMLEAGASAKEAADQAGFGSLAHLWRAFRRNYDLNPSTYRALHGGSPSSAAIDLDRSSA